MSRTSKKSGPYRKEGGCYHRREHSVVGPHYGARGSATTHGASLRFVPRQTVDEDARGSWSASAATRGMEACARAQERCSTPRSGVPARRRGHRALVCIMAHAVPGSARRQHRLAIARQRRFRASRAMHVVVVVLVLHPGRRRVCQELPRQQCLARRGLEPCHVWCVGGDLARDSAPARSGVLERPCKLPKTRVCRPRHCAVVGRRRKDPDALGAAIGLRYGGAFCRGDAAAAERGTTRRGLRSCLSRQQRAMRPRPPMSHSAPRMRQQGGDGGRYAGTRRDARWVFQRGRTSLLSISDLPPRSVGCL